MSNTGALRVSELDFDLVDSNFVEFMSTQDHWKDYDFRASGIRAISKQMAYALHYAGFYGNMLAAESFLDSAELRSTIVSHAKSLSYLPKSVSSARAEVDVVISPRSTETMPGTLVLDKGTAFTCRVSGENAVGDNGIIFVTTRSHVSTVNPGEDHVFSSVELRQGRFRSFDWVIDSRDVDQRLVLPHNRVDTSLMEVYVQEGSDDRKMVRYRFADDIVNAKSDSRIFFLEETEDSRFRVYFGDDVVGRAVPHGRVVRAIYFETSGADGNGFDVFNLTARLDSNAAAGLMEHSVSVITKQKSTGGAAPESKESIRFNAPRSFSTRKRALSNPDWRNVTKEAFPDVRDVKVWGGEDEDAPRGHFGNVYLSINPVSGAVLSQRRKDEIVKILKTDYRGMGVTPVIVDPERIFILVEGKIFSDRSQSFGDLNSLKKSARDAIMKYSAEELETFDGDLEHSRLAHAIDESDAAILSSLVRVRLEARLAPRVGSKQIYEFNFKNAVSPGTFFSNFITVENQLVQIDDDGEGNLRFYRTDTGVKRIVNSRAGSVNYADGSFTLGAVRIQRADPTTLDLRVGATPAEQNVKARFNKIVAIDPESIRLTVVEEVR